MRTDRAKAPSFFNSKRWKYDIVNREEVSPLEQITNSAGEVTRRLHSHSGAERNRLYLNRLGQDFSDVSALSGLDSIADGRAFAWWDYDRDGWQDIALVNANSPLLAVYHNDIAPALAASGHGTPGFVALRFVGGNTAAGASSEWSSRDGVGARAILHLGSGHIIRELRSGEGFAAQNSRTMIVGIGSSRAVDRIDVRWPSGRSQTLEDVNAGTLVTVFENPAQSATGQAVTREPYRRDSSFYASRNDKPPAGPAASSASFRMITTLATWCVACKTELPQLRYLRSRFPPERLSMLGVPVDPAEDRAMLEKFRDEHDPPYQILLDYPAAKAAKIQQHVHATAGQDVLPATLLANTQGDILVTIPGVPTASELARWMEDAAR